MARTILHILNSLLDLVVIAALLLSGSYAAYALWDNQQVYSAAEQVRTELLKLKPEEEAPDGESFARLQEINPDVCAWLSLEHTKIDYPVVQGSDNLSYLNRDVYGRFALSGSIYLDARNGRDFSDGYSLLYGHHMEQHKMFGDLDLYRDEAFFTDEPTGTLILPQGCCDLHIFAVLLVSASEQRIFEPGQTELHELLDFVSRQALHLDSEIMEEIASAEGPRILALSTCAGEFTDARTVVLAWMERCTESKEEEQR